MASAPQHTWRFHDFFTLKKGHPRKHTCHLYDNVSVKVPMASEDAADEFFSRTTPLQDRRSPAAPPPDQLAPDHHSAGPPKMSLCFPSPAANFVLASLWGLFVELWSRLKAMAHQGKKAKFWTPPPSWSPHPPSGVLLSLGLGPYFLPHFFISHFHFCKFSFFVSSVHFSCSFFF